MAIQARPRTRFPIPAIPALKARLRSATTTVVAIGVVALAVVLAAWINLQAQHTAERVTRAIALREHAERFLGHLRDAETGQRGYLLTGLASYLQPFTEGRGAVLPALETLDRLVEGAPNRFVIFDSPPALAASPAAELAKYVGQAVVVARADRTGQGSLEDAIRLLSGCPNIQLLLNAVHFSPSGRRFGSYYGYGG